MITILVVEDDTKLNFIVSKKLGEEGFEVKRAENPIQAFDIMEKTKVDMIVSDIMMPQMDGYEFAREVRSFDDKMPILFMTAKDDIASKKKGYDIGIDDYMVKPIDLVELVMRVEALLRRADIATEKQLQAGNLVLKEEETMAYYEGEELPLTVKEFQILFKMLSYPKKTFTRMQLMDEFWGFDSESNPRTVDVSITKLRDKISAVKEVEILTVRGLGYKAVIHSEEEPKDLRIDAKRPIWREFFMVFVVQTVCVFAGIGLYQNHALSTLGNWGIYVALILNTIFLAAVSMLFTKINYRMTFSKPIQELRGAARRVAGGDFTVRILPQRGDGKRDEMEVLIEDFNTMVTELAANETLKSDFIANVSHEIKTPIAIIQNYAQMLESQHLTEQEKKEYIHTIVESSERLSGLVQNILRLNKMESQAIVEKERFCLDEQLAECIIAFNEPFDEKELEVNIDLDEGVYIVSDESLLSIVWNNLLSNAIKYTQEGGTIDISMKKYGENGVLVSVKDNGCGMSEEVVRRIFDKFYQGDTSHTSKGNGLGLAMVKRVVELLDAKISVESEPEKGSTFTVEL